MTEIIPYFAALVTLLFAVGFYLAIAQPEKKESNKKTKGH